MNRILSILLLSMIAVTAVAQTFRYTYEGSTITYRVIDEENKTCEVPGNKGTSNLNDYLVLPQNPIYNNDTYELISIGDKAFFDEMVKTVTIPPSVVSIGELAFGACDKLYSINIPSSVTSIGKYAFSSCTGLTTIDIPSSVTSIGRSAFSGCSGLTNINLNASLTEIESSVFNGCVCLESINIPSSVTSIGDYAFSGCGNLIDIGIPLKVTTIGNSAFKACSRLKSIKIPSSVTTIGSDAFKDCSGLEKAEFETIESLCNIKFGGKESNPIYYSRNLYIGGEEIKDLVIPSTVSIIREYAFVKCNSLMSVSIPSTVVEIGNYAFAECENLRNVISYSKNPCVGENNIFDRCQNLMLNIPASSYNNYSRKSPWSQLECKLMIESIDLNYDTVKVPIGTKYDLSATAQPESASDRSLKWSSSDESVATVDEYGNVLAKAIGGCVITVSANDLSGISESCKVTVVPAAVERIELSHTEWSGFVNEHLTITAAVVPENAADKTLLWTSSDPSVATVDANGQVTAVGVGEAVITVTCGGVSAECKVVVNAKIISVESVTLDRTSVECNPGAVVQLTATVNPDDATDKSLSWSSSNEAVSTVDANGQITAVGVGEAVITVTCGGVSAECKVVVNAKIITVVSVALDRSNVECNPGAVVQLTATVNPDDAT
ncbi:MAG: leucine-rich repeat protein, partial [Bacteroides sp.]|nr:leucine-rich repeat protein [Bacteroides sp.]